MRIDEPKRLSRAKTRQNKVYPLVDWHPDQPDKLDIIDWWESQDFDLGIQEHLGNCIGCFKKPRKKTLKVIRDARSQFENDLEGRFGHVGPNKIGGVRVDAPRTMYREYMTAPMLIEVFDKTPKEYLADDTEEVNEGCASSCEPFAN